MRTRMIDSIEACCVIFTVYANLWMLFLSFKIFVTFHVNPNAHTFRQYAVFCSCFWCVSWQYNSLKFNVLLKVSLCEYFANLWMLFIFYLHVQSSAHTFLQPTVFVVISGAFLNSWTTVGYLLGVFFRLWYLFWSVFPLLLGANTGNLS